MKTNKNQHRYTCGTNENANRDDDECFEGINKIVWQRCTCSAELSFFSTRRAAVDIIVMNKMYTRWRK